MKGRRSAAHALAKILVSTNPQSVPEHALLPVARPLIELLRDVKSTEFQRFEALLAKLPPLLLAVGGGEVLLGENLRFAQLAQAAGAAVQVEVYESMWFVHPEQLVGLNAPPTYR